MTIEVKGVSEVVKAVDDLKKRATSQAESLRHTIGSVDTALDHVKELDDTLADAARELNALLGVATNNPPADVEGEEAEGEEAEGEDPGNSFPGQS